MKARIFTLLVAVLGVFAFGCKPNDLTLSSPDGGVAIKLTNNEGKLRYEVLSKDQNLIEPSEISLFPDQQATIINSRTSSNNSSWEPVWGQFSKVQDHYNELVLDVDYEGVAAQLFVRVYNNGIGFRYTLPNAEEAQEVTFLCQYQLIPEAAIYSPSGERVPLGPVKLSDLGNEEEVRLKIPLVVEKAGTPYLSLLESDLYSATAFKTMKVRYDDVYGALVSENKAQLGGDENTTPWRVILINEKLGDLVTNQVPLNLATPLQLEDPSWIKPGKTLWDWRVHGFTAEDGFTYGINTESYKRFIDFAAEKDIEYFLIDDAWYTKVTPGHFELSDKLDLQEVIDYAAEKDVELLLYYDRRHGEYGDDKLFEYYASLDMKGIKYGFMGSNEPFTRKAISQSAESKLLIDFHDGPVPMTGVARTMPNAITREFCHAQQDSRRAFTPETFIKMALINAIQGPLDMNNGNFDLTGINQGKREKGPRKTNSYMSTVVSEAARTLVIHSGLVCIPDAPEAYAAKADLFEFIQMQPVGKWDESKVLHAQMGDFITTARRAGEEWFVGSVYDERGGTLEIALDFLNDDQEYLVTFYEDTNETHGTTNPEAYQVRSGTVKKGDVIKAVMAPGGGHCMWIRPKE
ncbi:glycoside hydrolase family 97 protein [Marinoscillum furvescens]|nr:glycoside hydrolase family 97 protein [Marinoscillum furvescens]